VDTTVSESIRVLVVDDEQGILDSYREVLCPPDPTPESAQGQSLRELRSRLFPEAPGEPARPARRRAQFDVTACTSAEAAVDAVRAAVVERRPFASVFLDMRMPPGQDGAWAAEQIRALDEDIGIVMCSAYSDIDTEELSGRIPPEDKFFFLAKPFHPQEVRQMALTLGHKWRAERRIAQLAYYDTLTGLPNREQFRRRLSAALEDARAQARPIALLYIDLDNFKRINDTLGHTAGDQLLQITAERLRDAIRKSDDLIHVAPGTRRGNDCARLGGDEFMALLPEVTSPAEAGLVADRICKLLTAPLRLGTHEVSVSPSIGVAVFPQDGTDAETLLSHADLAMYAAKRQSPGSFAFYDDTMNVHAARQLRVEQELRLALARDEFSLCFQPQFELSTGHIVSVEALLRWDNATLGKVPPLDFIPLAEATGLMMPIGDWVLRTACAQARRWLDQGLSVARIAVNVSPVQFAQRNFVDWVMQVLADTGLPPDRLELEITESLVMTDETWADQVLRRLKAAGVAFAIDDFGTGYSSFGRLKELPVDRLKIDRSFLRAPGQATAQDGAIVSAMINMARTMGLGVVAEGIEDFEQLLFLQENTCPQGQGYLLGKPLDAAGTEAFLKRMEEHRTFSDTQRLRALVK
jgi:diguanylate cyclase (GGDEF)-like protein